MYVGGTYHFVEPDLGKRTVLHLPFNMIDHELTQYHKMNWTHTLIVQAELEANTVPIQGCLEKHIWGFQTP